MNIQATSISTQHKLTLAVVYCLPKQKISLHQFTNFFQSLEYKFIAGGSFNAKHVLWGSKTNLSRGLTLEQTIRTLFLDTLTTNEPTYCPAAHDKSPDLLDFGIIKELNKVHFLLRSQFRSFADSTRLSSLTSIHSKHDIMQQ